LEKTAISPAVLARIRNLEARLPMAFKVADCDNSRDFLDQLRGLSSG
jgi:hypothetical protein